MGDPPGELDFAPDIGEVRHEKFAVKKEKVPRFGVPVHGQDDLTKFSYKGKSTYLTAGVQDRAEHERGPFSIVPINRPAGAFRFRNAFGLQFIELNENPFQMARPRT